MNQIGPKGGCASNESSQYLTKVGDYVSFFKGLKSDPANVIVAGIMGPTTPYEVELRTPPGGGTAIPAVAHSCSYVGGTGSPEVADPFYGTSQAFEAALDAIERGVAGLLEQLRARHAADG